MKLSKTQFKELVKASVLVRVENTTTYLYQGVRFLFENYGIFEGFPEGLDALSLPVNTPGTTAWGRINVDLLIDTLWFRTQFNKTLFFKSGTVRHSFLTELEERLESHRKIYPATQEMIQKVEQNWFRLPDDIKNRLSPFFTEDGECTITFRVITVFTKEGSRKDIRGNPNKYKPLPACFESPIFTSKGEAENIPILFNGQNLLLTSTEYKYLTTYYKQCECCKAWVEEGELIFGLCRGCTGTFPSELQGYQTRAHEIFDSAIGKSKYSSTLLGVELEYELAGNKKEALFLLHKHLKNHAIFKRDGSLKDGVEICTRPASIDIHLEEFKKLFDDSLLWERIKVESTCGMHVHIDRRKMSALSLGKIIKFLQEGKNQSFLETIAGRGGNRYAKLATGLSITSHHQGLASSDRYQGINTQNQDTAEIRIFRTPDTYNKFVQNLEFVSALSDFVQPANSGIKDLSTGGFLNFVRNNRSIYKELYKFTKENC